MTRPAGGGVFVGDAGEILVDRGKYDGRPKALWRNRSAIPKRTSK